ncbi:MAG: SusC/RagA family TonB-linked outer membrane protein [Gemmatimonadota bacterium]|nr:SusC/RagA family TonB-linked outer membrane protein [Gemmatimonadota bacterium]
MLAGLAPAFLCALAIAASSITVPTAMFAQAGTPGRITGTVRGSAGEPVNSAQVGLQGTRFSAIADSAGRYSINGVPAGSYSMRVQRVGYAPQTQSVTVPAGETVVADVHLTALPMSLAAQVVVGYTTQQRRDISDATASVSGEEIQDQKVATIEQALQGRIAGVQIASSGEPGRIAQIFIRGQNFVNSVSSPLYVVDGMYMTENPNLNPDDIESIDVLKDASAAAQYGAQAANGVVVIRTRRGRSGDTRVELRTYYGFQAVPKRIDMMNSTGWGALTLQAYQNAGLTPPSGALNPAVSTEWQSAVFRQGAIQDHNLTVSGGSSSANYLVSGGYLEQQGALIATDFRRYSLRINSEAQRGRLTFGENVAVSQLTQSGLPGGRYPLIDVVRLLPSIPVYDPNNPGGYGYGSDANPTFGTNPVGQLLAQSNKFRSNQVIGTVYGDVSLFPSLHYRLNVGLNYNGANSNQFINSAQLRYRSPILTGATLTENRNDFTSVLIENLLNFDQTVRGIHHFNAVGGYTQQQQNTDFLTAFRQGFPNESLRELSAGNTANFNNNGTQVKSALQAWLGRVNYSLKERYLLSGSVRRDCSSRFGPSNRCASFGAGSLGWVMSEEGFYSKIPFFGSRVNFLKIRGSTGVLGNQDIGDYTYSAPIQSNQNYILGGSIQQGATQISLANPNIKWQSNRQSDVGVDFGVLGDRVTITTDYYQSTSNGLLVNAPIPLSLGATGSPVVNAGSVRNTGFEFALTHHYTRGDFSLNSNLNLTTTKNRVLSLGNGNQPIFDNTGVARTAVGGPIGEFFLIRTAGIFQSAAEVAASSQKGAKPGDVRYVDQNNDGLINNDDRVNVGSGIPSLTGGLFFDGRYKALDFGINLRGARGNKIFNVVKYWTDRGDDPNNFRAGYTPWTPTNHSTTTPRVVFGPEGAANAQLLTDRWLEDGKYLRIQNVLVGYTLPSSWMRKLQLPAATPRVYLNMQNLFTFTHYSNWDPETLGYGNALGRGIDDGYIYPNVRTITFGLDFRL